MDNIYLFMRNLQNGVPSAVKGKKRNKQKKKKLLVQSYKLIWPFFIEFNYSYNGSLLFMGS